MCFDGATTKMNNSMTHFRPKVFPQKSQVQFLVCIARYALKFNYNLGIGKCKTTSYASICGKKELGSTEIPLRYA